ncbi:IS66 family insertion sequence element accessory protein TnpA [Desulfurivibrio dismutans]|uniref:IS66 family insertion sequence element accessory protein TnpA n=1 Tax=Desulfurivibrio dismutans TaxID=1398908 RepID=UPI0023DC77D4|nr:hypothetical protein [Desulfurivibrio alkaliphilus]MDF1615672.1 hypothetical protein [Desulfurivibrio alkaliphilus]
MDKNGRGSKRRFWVAHLSAWERSGLTQTAYCREYGLSRHAFGWWRRKFRDRPAAELPVLVQVPTVAGPKVTVGDFSGLRLLLPRGLGLEINRGFDVATLSRVIASLEVGR